MCGSAHQDDQVMNLISIICIFWKILTFCDETCFCNYSVICLKNQMIVMCITLLYICPECLFFNFIFLLHGILDSKANYSFQGCRARAVTRETAQGSSVKIIQQWVSMCENCSAGSDHAWKLQP